MKRVVIFLFLALFQLTLVYSTSVDIEAQIYQDYTIFNYNIDLGEDSVSSFSLEKLPDSRVQIAKGDDETLSYTTAGDFFIFRTNNNRASKFELKIRSELASNQIFEKESFSHYVSFNFPIDNLSFKVILMENIGEIKEAFPRTFDIADEGGIVWVQEQIETDTLFLINFENVDTTSQNSSNSNFSYIILLLFLPILLFILLFYIVKRSPEEPNQTAKKSVKKESKKEKPKSAPKKSIKEKSEVKKESKKEKPKEQKKEEIFKEILGKYLTENEQEVVKLVKKNQGISQYDILNYLPSFTKSNLSKIISKLHNKKILNRIRVGKVNKIYLGERFEIEEETKEE